MLVRFFSTPYAQPGYRRNDAIGGGVNVGGPFAQVQGLVTVLNSESG